ncbi:ABC transporter ATP-binding protein [Cohnella laeviribosi]|jgi:ABC-type polysaccharide/polyol phosphate transport system ATPase subunit|uniref:ABC transporter ATP-binding protein n=1 Tax=Cohnella laeviribosi TaxID=380174 RepID=UPI003D2052F8
MNAIEVNNVSKSFKNYIDKPNTLKERFLRVGKNNYQEHWVLKSINLHIKCGETVALVGRNGSGKSTLLKLMTKILYPSSGEIIVRGRVSSLLELGAGFHPDFTGRENIYMNASILGLTKKEIDYRLNDIIRFSELDEYIDQPIRIYSSGMYMRLAFSVAISVEPDVLLVDEVLAVGDAAFQNKCIEKIKELKGKGTTIVIVAHDNGVVEKICDRAVWLHNGEIADVGRPRDIVMKYMNALAEIENKRLLREQQEEQEQQVQLAKSDQQNESINNGVSIQVEEKPVSHSKNRTGNQKIEITDVAFCDPEGVRKQNFRTGTPMYIHIYYKVNQTYENAVFGIGIFTSDNTCCYATNTYIDHYSVEQLGKSGVVICKIDPLMLIPATYFVDIAVHHENGEPYDYLTRLYSFQVSSDIRDQGIARLKHSWEINYSDGGSK